MDIHFEKDGIIISATKAKGKDIDKLYSKFAKIIKDKEDDAPRKIGFEK